MRKMFKQMGENWYMSDKRNNGEFDYWVVMEVTDWFDAVGEREAPGRWLVELKVVSPSEAGEENLKRAYASCGMDGVDTSNPEIQVELLKDYGVCAPIFSMTGNNLRKLMKEARQKARLSDMLFGFFMDVPVNLVGATGWDAVRGDLFPTERKEVSA
jgi:hypothetical protein